MGLSKAAQSPISPLPDTLGRTATTSSACSLAVRPGLKGSAAAVVKPFLIYLNLCK